MVFGLSLPRFRELAQLATKAREQEAKEEFILAAFIGFQMGAAGKQNFGQYLRSLHLAEGPVETKVTKKKSRKKDTELDDRLRGMGIVPEKDNRK